GVFVVKPARAEAHLRHAEVLQRRLVCREVPKFGTSGAAPELRARKRPLFGRSRARPLGCALDLPDNGSFAVRVPSRSQHRTRLADRGRLRGMRAAAGVQVCGAALRIGTTADTTTCPRKRIKPGWGRPGSNLPKSGTFVERCAAATSTRDVPIADRPVP